MKYVCTKQQLPLWDSKGRSKSFNGKRRAATGSLFMHLLQCLNFTSTFRLISWTGRKIDPVGVDYILQKLGFHHARTTIPKWLQRGVMDPLDKVLSVLIKKLGTALQDEKEKRGRDKEEHWGTQSCHWNQSCAKCFNTSFLYLKGHYFTMSSILHSCLLWCLPLGVATEAFCTAVFRFLYILNKLANASIIWLLYG